MEEVRFGVIGAGMMGRLHAASLASRVPGARLAAVADLNPGACASLVAEVSVEAVYEDYRRMLALADIRAVVIATPPHLHAEMIDLAAREGKHIFCEKPIDVDVSKVDRALDSVRDAGVMLQIGFNRRFDTRFREAQREVRAGKIGTPLTLHIVSRDPVRSVGELPKFEPEIFLDTTIHDFDMARFVMGDEIASVEAFAAGSGDRTETAITVLRFEGGALGVIDNSWLSTYGYDQRLEVFGTAGAVRVENEEARAPGTEGAPFFVQRYFDSYVAEMQAFVECVLHDRQPSVTGADGRAAVVPALAAQRSLREGRQVAMSEIG